MVVVVVVREGMVITGCVDVWLCFLIREEMFDDAVCSLQFLFLGRLFLSWEFMLALTSVYTSAVARGVDTKQHNT